MNDDTHAVHCNLQNGAVVGVETQCATGVHNDVAFGPPRSAAEGAIGEFLHECPHALPEQLPAILHNIPQEYCWSKRTLKPEASISVKATGHYVHKRFKGKEDKWPLEPCAAMPPSHGRIAAEAGQVVQFGEATRGKWPPMEK